MSVTQLRDDTVGCESGLPDSQATEICPLCSVTKSTPPWALEGSLQVLTCLCPFTVYLPFIEGAHGVLSSAEIQESCMPSRNLKSCRRNKTGPQTPDSSQCVRSAVSGETDSLSNLKEVTPIHSRPLLST